MTTYPLGLVLGGGGARGFAHLGVAQAMYEKGIFPDIISGVSAGAIAGAFLAAKMQPLEIFKLLKDQDFMKLSQFKWSKQGMIRLDGLKEQMNKHIPYQNLEDLPIPLLVAVCNLNTAKVEYLSNGPLSDIIVASSSIPVLFAPAVMDNQVYVDGGVLDNLPIKPIRKICDKVIAVNISPIHDTDKLGNVFQIATRVFHVAVDKSTIKSGKQADLYIEPPGVDHFDLLKLKRADEIFHIAYAYAKELIERGF